MLKNVEKNVFRAAYCVRGFVVRISAGKPRSQNAVLNSFFLGLNLNFYPVPPQILNPVIMSNIKVLVVRAPGINCDEETAYAFELAGAKPECVHINRILENPGMLDSFGIACFPGGFSFGDDIAAGRILANLIRHHLMESFLKFKAAGKPILGICNGFQVLIKSGLMFDDSTAEPPATLSWNDSGKYLDRWVTLEVAPNSNCIFLEGIETISLPIAHAEGKFQVRNAEIFESMKSSGQFPLRYLSGDNPNGSQGDVAGFCDSGGRVFGLMPHPERFFDPLQHPRWTRGESTGEHGDGLALFRNAVRCAGKEG